jgi:diaminohydroxyphosphoribosylaminopyrimidine deaminase/5-amino-6-(5-phosphoribosylamino)uracil reductase
MDRACELAERGRYTAAPNPLVGAVVVRDGGIVGEGFHVRAGEDHAEVVALEDCGGAARGSTLYVTLEPCNHHGRTPPCTEAIISAGVSRVVIGHLDPDPRMRGQSVELLRAAGVEVEVVRDPVLTARLGKQNEQFFHYMATGRPFVHVKLAMTLDGRISSGGGPERITGDDSRYRVHLLRAEAGTVLVGAGTARADDPLLDARHLPPEVRPTSVTRVVLDPSLSLDADSKLVESAPENPVVVFAAEASFDGRQDALKKRSVDPAPVPGSGKDGMKGLDLGFVLDELGSRGLRGLLVEGGGETVGRFAEAGLIDKMTLFYAPRLIGSGGVPAVGHLKPAAVDGTSVTDTSGFRVENVERFEEDVALTLYPAEQISHGSYGKGA